MQGVKNWPEVSKWLQADNHRAGWMGMSVMGATDGLQLIFLVDSQGKVYFLMLHLVALNVEDFLVTGAASAPIRSIKYREFCAPK